MGNTRRIVSHTAIYGFGQALRGLASFIMLPIYTRYLAPADYGVVELLTVIIDLTALLIGARVAVGIFKYYSDAEDPKSKRQVLATALLLLVLANAVGVLALWLGSGVIATMLSGPEGFEMALRAFAFTLVLGAINEVFFAYLRVLDRPVSYVTTNVLKLVLQLGLNILFIVYMDLGYWGIIWAALLSNLALTIGFGLWMGPMVGVSVSRDYARKLVGYSLPIILASLGMYYITFGDRYFLKYFQGLEAVGVYALAYKFGFLLFSLIWGPFSTYWSAKQFDHAREPGAPRLFGQVFFYANLPLLVAAAGIIVTVPPFIRLIAAPGYWPAIEVVPWIVIAYVLQCWTEYVRFGILQSGRTGHIAWGTLITAVLITFLYWFWIPAEGAVGAAKATLVAFAARFIYTLVIAQRLFFIDIPWARILGLALYLALVCFVLQYWDISGWLALIGKGGVVVAASAVALLTPLIEEEHRARVMHAVRGMVGRIGRQCERA